MPLGGRKQSNWIADQDQERVLLTRLMSTLTPVLGPDRVRATVDVEYDPSTVEENQESYDPNSQVAVSQQSSEEQSGSGTGVGGVPGTASNIPGKAIATQSAAGTDAHMAKTDAQTFAVNRLSRHTMEPAGRIRRITAAVAVDDIVETAAAGQAPRRRKWTPEELAKIEQLAQDSLGIDTKRGDHLAIQNVSFDQPPVEVPAKVTPIQKVRTTIQDWSTAVRYVSLLLLFVIAYFLMLRPVKQEVINTFKALAKKQDASAIAAAKAPKLKADERLDGLFSEETQDIKKQVIERVKKDPAPTGRLIQAWITEDAE
jgi:flagellar M-ring protein FliF